MDTQLQLLIRVRFSFVMYIVSKQMTQTLRVWKTLNFLPARAPCLQRRSSRGSTPSAWIGSWKMWIGILVQRVGEGKAHRLSSRNKASFSDGVFAFCVPDVVEFHCVAFLQDLLREEVRLDRSPECPCMALMYEDSTCCISK